MPTYQMEPERRTLHGHFSPDLPPVLTVQPGDTVVFRTLDAGWTVQRQRTSESADTPERFEPRDKERDSGHALCGPVAVAGAQPGMTLTARFDEIVPANWGWCLAGGWPSPVNSRLGLDGDESHVAHQWALDPEGRVGVNQHGHRVRLRPFMGVSGVAPAEPGIHSTTPPRAMGGNIDCKELVAGSTLYLPVAVSGALFSTGDGHAAQGDGEVSGIAIECPMERVAITFGLLPDLRLKTPRAETPAGWLTFGFHEDLDEATNIALDAMLGFLGERLAIGRSDALALASLVVDLRVTQIVNGVRGVHALLPHDALALL